MSEMDRHMHAAGSSYRVRVLIREIRARWRRRAVLQGAALAAGVMAVWGASLLLLLRFGAVPPIVLVVGAVMGLIVVLGFVVQVVLRPALRKISDRQIALYVEERIPDLEDRLNSAVEVERTQPNRTGLRTDRARGGLQTGRARGGFHADGARDEWQTGPARGGFQTDRARVERSALIDRLIDDASERARTIPLTTVVDRKKERMLSAAGAVGLVLFGVLVATSLDDLRMTFGGANLASLVPAAQPLMTVNPGNAVIEQGASQEIVVSLREETDRDVYLHFRQGDGAWQKESMQAAIGEPAYLHEFLDVQEPIEYFVAHDQDRSEPFAISLYSFPAVEQIDQTYTYPEYTGLQPRREENVGDVHGLKGSTVTLEVHTTGTVQEAELVVDGERRVRLAAAGDGRFRGRLRLEDAGFYTVLLTDAEAKQNRFPEEYRIVPVEDEKPYVMVTDPQRDVRANAVEEVLVGARAVDDIGLKSLRLRFAVNADAEQVVELAAPSAAEAEGEHLFFLEDYELSAGDVISYFVEAEDFLHETPAATDMYFIEVIPFDREYSQAAAGGMQGGGGQASGVVLSQQQIIAATWKLYREQDETAEEEVASARRGLVQAQGNLRRNIEERINSTAFSLELDENTRAIAEHLRAAVQAMRSAVGELEGDRLREALVPEREALNQLLKADALNKERQIALNRGSQGGAGGSATEERMTELMDLELDIAKDKYETLPQGSSGGGGGEVDEALQKIRELARRQQNLENESGRALEGEDQRRRVERLQRDQDELRRQAEDVSRGLRRMARRDGRLGEDAEEQLERVAENMREAERALRSGDVQRARARQRQAVNDLERVAQDLRRAGNEDRRGALEEMDRTFDRLQDQERQLARDLNRAADGARSQGGRVDREEAERLAEQRRSQRETLERLDEQAEALAGRSSDDPELDAAARRLRQRLRREALDEHMQASEESLRRGWLDRAQRREDAIREGLGRLEEEMRAFEEHLPLTDEERLARSLNELHELERELRSLEEQMSGESPSSPSSSSSRLNRARESLDRMQRDLGGTQAAQGLEELRRALGRADHTGVSLEGESAAAFFNEDVFAPLSALEAAIRSELDRVAMEKKLYGSRSGDVPDEYRELVEKYYESLSKSAR